LIAVRAIEGPPPDCLEETGQTKGAATTHLPSAAAYALAQDLKSVPPDEREIVCAQAIAMLAEQEQREAEDELLVRYGFA
jgi:hypothetical protein